MRIDYTGCLQQLYPMGTQYNRMLPRGTLHDPDKPSSVPAKINLSTYGLICNGLLGVGGFTCVYDVTDQAGKHYACKVADLSKPSLNGALPLEIAENTLQEIKLQQQLIKSRTAGILSLVKYYPSVEEIQKTIQKLKQKPNQKCHIKILQLTPLCVPYISFLDAFFMSHRKLTIQQSAALLLDLSEAVQKLHDQRMIHRDIKPSNLYIGPENGKLRLLISDFNTSRGLQSKSGKSFSITMRGSDGYMSPYLFRNGMQNGGYAKMTYTEALKLDVYAIGVIGYMLHNNGQMAPKQNGTMPYPKNSPSDEFSRFIIRMLEPNVAKAMPLQHVIETLYQFYRFGTASGKNSRQSQPPSRKPAAKSKEDGSRRKPRTRFVYV